MSDLLVLGWGGGGAKPRHVSTGWAAKTMDSTSTASIY